MSHVEHVKTKSIIITMTMTITKKNAHNKDKEEWPECIARQMQRIVIIQSVTDLNRFDDAPITGWRTWSEMRWTQRDKEARRRIRARIMTWARKVVEDSAAEAHNWLTASSQLPTNLLDLFEVLLSLRQDLLYNYSEAHGTVYTHGTHRCICFFL